MKTRKEAEWFVVTNMHLRFPCDYKQVKGLLNHIYGEEKEGVSVKDIFEDPYLSKPGNDVLMVEEKECWCEECCSVIIRPMIVCPTCGNKRCPRARWHGYKCTNSNEPNQTGERI